MNPKHNRPPTQHDPLFVDVLTVVVCIACVVCVIMYDLGRRDDQAERQAKVVAVRSAP
jgi:hypothetical protein